MVKSRSRSARATIRSKTHIDVEGKRESARAPHFVPLRCEFGNRSRLGLDDLDPGVHGIAGETEGMGEAADPDDEVDAPAMRGVALDGAAREATDP